MRIAAVAATELFTGTALRPAQVVRVTLAGHGPDAAAQAGQPVTVTVAGPGVSTPDPAVTRCPGPGQEAAAEVAVEIAAPAAPGSTRQVTAAAALHGGQRAELPAAISVAEAGWTMWMVSHFHYDPVWWSTQGQFTQSRIFLPEADGSLPDSRTAFELVRLHLAAARTDPDYKFVLAEIDYLKPYFDAHPGDRADLLSFIAAGRVEIVGGSYNEPNTNLTSAESTIRNAVHGLAYQREMLGADPATAWMLDSFGHDPGYPGLMAAAGLAESAWARGPYHQWGPQRTVGDNRRMQFASEFEWLSPDGGGLLTSYMANHYGAGWVTHQAATAAAAAEAALEQFRQLAPVAATRNVLLPVGADHVIPSRWVTAIHRDWNARYVWPRFVTALPCEFFAAVRKDAASRDTWITPQTRDMNPVYPGKDVSYIDTKQAQRAAEVAVAGGERLATLAWLHGAAYPVRSLDKAWRLLAFGAHHDAITGTESDQVYLDLLAGWREACERGEEAGRRAAGHLAGLADTTGPPGSVPVAVFNTLSRPRSGLVTVTVEFAAPGPREAGLADGTGAALGCLAAGQRRHPDGTLAAVTLTFLAAGVPALGYRTYWAGQARAGQPAAAGWADLPGQVIENEFFTVTADPARGGALSQVTDRRSGQDLLAGPGNDLILQEEYSQHPRWGEGPWLLSVKGPGTRSSRRPAAVRAQRCPAGSRLVAGFSLGGLRVTQETLLWDGADRVEFRTHLDGAIGQDRLLRVAFPARVPGGRPVFQAATAVIGRTPGSPDADAGEHSFSLDCPAHEWFAAGSTARVALGGGGRRAIGVAEVITPGNAIREPVRSLMLALARAGVTATCSLAGGPRYGSIDADSNLPDVRITLGGPGQNPFTASVLAAAGPGPAADLAAQLAAGQAARVWVPAGRGRAQAFAPGADLRGPADLPVLIVAGGDLAAAVEAVAADLADAVIEVPAGPAGTGQHGPGADLAGHSVALLNRGTPGSLVTPDGVLLMSLMRACSGWPCGVWIDGEKRTVPDGSSFAFQHWSHTFEYALAAGPGDWRGAGFALAGEEYNHGLLAVQASQHPGPLPALASLAEVTPPQVSVSALKPRGNPLSPAGQPGREAGITVRLRDLSGAAGPVPARLRLRGGVAAAAGTDLCERQHGPDLPVSGGAVAAAVPPSGFATLWLRPAAAPAPPRPAGEAGQAAGPADPAEPAQPVFTRYWLHGKGPAPAGNLPVAVHLSPARIALAVPGEPAAAARARIALTVACGQDGAAGQLTLAVPAQLTVAPAGPLRYDLPARGHASWDLEVRPAPGAPGGRYYLAAQAPDPGGQLTEDAILVTVGEPAPPPLDLPLDELLPRYLAGQQADGDEVQVRLLTPRLRIEPGGEADLVATVRNNTAAQIRGEAQLISPHGSWAAARPWARGFLAGPGQELALRFPVRVPAAERPGQDWWALVKVAYFGSLRYSEAAAVIIGG
jgi:alpha-mannosidase